MQGFFNSRTLSQIGCDAGLVAASDNLLRALANVASPPYSLGKLGVARDLFEQYRQERAFRSQIALFVSKETIAENCRYLHGSLFELTEGAEKVDSFDYFLLRLNVAVVEYGTGLRHGKRMSYPSIPQSLHSTLRDFLDAALKVNLNCKLPDPLDQIDVSDMKRYCQAAWDRLGA